MIRLKYTLRVTGKQNAVQNKLIKEEMAGINHTLENTFFELGFQKTTTQKIVFLWTTLSDSCTSLLNEKTVLHETLRLRYDKRFECLRKPSPSASGICFFSSIR